MKLGSLSCQITRIIIIGGDGTNKLHHATKVSVKTKFCIHQFYFVKMWAVAIEKLEVNPMIGLQARM